MKKLYRVEHYKSKEEWLLARTKGFGGSSVSALFGKNKHKTALDIYCSAVNPTEELVACCVIPCVCKIVLGVRWVGYYPFAVFLPKKNAIAQAIAKYVYSCNNARFHLGYVLKRQIFCRYSRFRFGYLYRQIYGRF